MAENILAELRNACQSISAVTDHKLLEVGETAWLAGHAAPASKGTITLRIGNASTVVVQEKDIVEVKKRGEQFMIRVKAGSEVLYKLEIVSQIRESASRNSGSCHCHGAEANEKPEVALAQNLGGSGGLGGGDDVQGLCQVVCVISWRRFGRALVPILNCGVVCPPGTIIV